MEVHIVYNPIAGSGKATSVLEDQVRPRLLSWLSEHVSNVEVNCHETSDVESARKIGNQLGSRHASLLTLVIIGGDGTIHEIIDGLVAAERFDAACPKHEVHLVIVPTGTANALFHSLFGPGIGANGLTEADRLLSLESLVRGGSPDLLRPLTLLGVQHSYEPDAPIKHGLVVSSHALHAAIVRDSESLRAELPDIERFKVAAERNGHCWWNATVRLEGNVKRYEPKSQSFVPVRDIPGYNPTEDGSLTLDGPFIYFNAMVIDRLERNFVPATFASNCQDDVMRSHNEIDFVVIRPLRSRVVREALELKKPVEEVRATFAHDVLMPTLLVSMYNEGVHVGKVYMGPDGNPEKRDGWDVPIVEYFCAQSYEWTAHDDQSRTSCVDGSIIDSQTTRGYVSDAVGVFAWTNSAKCHQ